MSNKLEQVRYMITANELKIGNLVLLPNPNIDKNYPQICRIFRIDEKEDKVQIERLEHEDPLDGTLYYKCFKNQCVNLLPLPNRIYTVLSSLVDINSIYTLPLTEEILLKCGFKKSKTVNTTFIMEMKTYSLSPTIRLYAYEDDKGFISDIRLRQGQNRIGNMIRVNSLHQLQNLYFALTQEELDLNL